MKAHRRFAGCGADMQGRCSAVVRCRAGQRRCSAVIRCGRLRRRFEAAVDGGVFGRVFEWGRREHFEVLSMRGRLEERKIVGQYRSSLVVIKMRRRLTERKIVRQYGVGRCSPRCDAGLRSEGSCGNVGAHWHSSRCGVDLRKMTSRVQARDILADI